MKFLKIYLLVVFILISNACNSIAGNHFDVQIQTSPLTQNIGPDKDFVETQIIVKDASGQIVPNVYLRMEMHSPKKNPLISTDFPWVEGTDLMEYEGYLKNGIFNFKYIYPIRGEYLINVYAGADEEAPSEKHTLSLVIHGNHKEFINLLIFIAILFGFGVAAGFVIAKGNESKNMIALNVFVFSMLSILFFNIPNAQADHGHELYTINVTPLKEVQSNNQMNLTFEMNPGSGKVGMINFLKFMVKDSEGHLTPNTTFDVNFWHIEDEKSIFSTVLFSKDGQAKLNFQFFDGAEHEIRVVAKNDLGEIQLSKIVQVQALNPSMAVKIKTTFYFVMCTFLGICVGLKLKR